MSKTKTSKVKTKPVKAWAIVTRYGRIDAGLIYRRRCFAANALIGDFNESIIPVKIRPITKPKSRRRKRKIVARIRTTTRSSGHAKHHHRRNIPDLHPVNERVSQSKRYGQG